MPVPERVAGEDDAAYLARVLAFVNVKEQELAQGAGEGEGEAMEDEEHDEQRGKKRGIEEDIARVLAERAQPSKEQKTRPAQQPPAPPSEVRRSDDHALYDRAKQLAETLVGGNGLLDLHATRKLASEADERLFKATLSFLNHNLLVKVHKGAVDEAWHHMVTQEVLNTSLLRSEWHARHVFLNCEANEVPVETSLVPVYSTNGVLRAGLFGFRSLSDEELLHPRIEPADTVGPNYWTRPVLPSRGGFVENFHRFTSGLLEDIDWNGLFVAGGAVVASLLAWKQANTRRGLKLPAQYRNAEKIEAAALVCSQYGLPPELIDDILPHVLSEEDKQGAKVEHAENLVPPRRRRETPGLPFASSDTDLFLIASSQEEANNRLKYVVDHITTKLGPERKESMRLVRTANAVTVWCGYPFRPIQILVVMYRSMEEVLAFFDLDCVSVGFDGHNVFCLPRFLRAVNTGYNFVEPSKLRRWSTGPRICKYAKRGFGTVFFEVCKHSPRCDVVIDEDTASRIAAVHGNVSVEDELGYGEVHVPFHPNLIMGMHFDKYVETRLAKEQIMMQRVQINEDGTVQVMDPRAFCYEKGSQDIDSLMSRPELPNMRWKRVDLWESRRGNEFLPKCYMCQKRIDPSITLAERPLVCRECERVNQQKQARSVDLKGKVAIVTGGRIKIGYATALRLLQMGASVVVTTRFPKAAAKAYKAEKDFAVWGHRLHIYALDFRFIAAVNEFAAHIASKFPVVDILINNAAQTIRRPPAYYRQLFVVENELPEFPELIRTLEPIHISDQHGGQLRLPQPHELSQIPLLKSDLPALPDAGGYDVMFPQGVCDMHGEQLDMRPATSWTQQPGEVPMLEAVEVQLINAVAPFALINMLWTNMVSRVSGDQSPRFIVNVSSPEGQFSHPFKTGAHPHTNMAKASLNMLTRTLSSRLEQHKVYITSVDTGWVSSMVPEARDVAWNNRKVPPLQISDAAARVLDPVITGLRGNPVTGVLLRNFKQSCW